MESNRQKQPLQGFYIKKKFLQIPQYSQENKCVGVSFFLKTCNFIKKRLQCMCFPVNISKFLDTPIFKDQMWTAVWSCSDLKKHFWKISLSHREDTCAEISFSVAGFTIADKIYEWIQEISKIWHDQRTLTTHLA